MLMESAGTDWLIAFVVVFSLSVTTEDKRCHIASKTGIIVMRRSQCTLLRYSVEESEKIVRRGATNCVAESQSLGPLDDVVDGSTSLSSRF